MGLERHHKAAGAHGAGGIQRSTEFIRVVCVVVVDLCAVKAPLALHPAACAVERKPKTKEYVRVQREWIPAGMDDDDAIEWIHRAINEYSK